MTRPRWSRSAWPAQQLPPASLTIGEPGQQLQAASPMIGEPDQQIPAASLMTAVRGQQLLAASPMTGEPGQQLLAASLTTAEPGGTGHRQPEGQWRSTVPPTRACCLHRSRPYSLRPHRCWPRPRFHWRTSCRQPVPARVLVRRHPHKQQRQMEGRSSCPRSCLLVCCPGLWLFPGYHVHTYPQETQPRRTLRHVL